MFGEANMLDALSSLSKGCLLISNYGATGRPTYRADDRRSEKVTRPRDTLEGEHRQVDAGEQVEGYFD